MNELLWIAPIVLLVVLYVLARQGKLGSKVQSAVQSETTKDLAKAKAELAILKAFVMAKLH